MPSAYKKFNYIVYSIFPLAIIHSVCSPKFAQTIAVTTTVDANLGENRVSYGEMENRKYRFNYKIVTIFCR